MGTYTTNKNLFMPTVGEQGWGTLVNGNFETIDIFLKPITVSGSTYTFTGNHVGNQSGGSISATSITNSGTLTNTGMIYANGGINADLSSCFDVITDATEIGALHFTTTNTIFSSNSSGTYSQTFTYRSNPFCNTVKFKLTVFGYSSSPGTSYVKVNGVTVASVTDADGNIANSTTSNEVTLNNGDTILFYNHCPNAGQRLIQMICDFDLCSASL